MSSDAEAHVLYRIGNALVLEYPYPHILVRDIFPDDFYRELRENLPEAQQMSTVESLGRVSIGVNPGRVVLPLTRENCARLGGRKGQFWERLGSWLMGDTFGQMMIRKFGPWLEQRFPDLSQARLQHEALIQREETHF